MRLRKEKNKLVLIVYSLTPESGIKKMMIQIYSFSYLHNIYQRQSWKYP